MCMDAFEGNPQLLARWSGGEDLKKAVIASFEYGECRRVLEKLEGKKISIRDAVAEISRILDDIHKDVHSAI